MVMAVVVAEVLVMVGCGGVSGYGVVGEDDGVGVVSGDDSYGSDHDGDRAEVSDAYLPLVRFC